MPAGKSKPKPRPQPYDGQIRKNIRQLRKKAESQEASTSAIDELNIDTNQNIDNSDNIVDTNLNSDVQVNTNMNDQPVSRGEFLALQNNVEKILQSISQMNNKANQEISFPTDNGNRETGDIPIEISMTQSVNSQDNVGNSEVTAQVQRAVAGGMDSLLNTGENIQVTLPGRPIDMKISNKIKQQIWANEYVDLDCLLDFKQEHNNEYHIVNKEGGFAFEVSKPNKTIGNLGQWCSAFMVYLTIYCRKYPEQLSDLTTYLSTIKLLCHRGGDYLTYDKEFRILRQSTNIPFSVTHTTLWLECRDAPAQNKMNNSKSSGKKNNFRPKTATNSKPDHPFGYCFKFHEHGNCTRQNCMYSHTCYNEGCNLKHPVFKCSKNTDKSANKSENKTTYPNKSS